MTRCSVRPFLCAGARVLCAAVTIVWRARGIASTVAWRATLKTDAAPFVRRRVVIVACHARSLGDRNFVVRARSQVAAKIKNPKPIEASTIFLGCHRQPFFPSTLPPPRLSYPALPVLPEQTTDQPSNLPSAPVPLLPFASLSALPFSHPLQMFNLSQATANQATNQSTN